MFLAIIVVGLLNWQVALNSGGLTVDKGNGYGVVLISHDQVKLGDVTLTGQFQPTATPDQLQ
jgi:hypothetical protein